MNKVKLLVVGPQSVGKSYIANYLSETIEQPSGEYRPTQGVRIVEFEVPLTVRGKKTKMEVELWDVSGDRKFESCWPATARDAQGVILVYNQDTSSHEKEMETWHLHFVQVHGFRDSQCCIISHKKPNTADRDIVQLSDTFAKMVSVASDIEENGEQLREDFVSFLTNLVSALTERNEEEENHIMNS